MKLEVRAVQLDLARQQESIVFIKQFCDFIADNGFNTLVLYLEGRIRTDSFPYPAENESYSLDEMKNVVEYAAAHGIDIIPVVSTLGHAEQFLQYKGITHLAELRDGDDGRFFNSRAKHMFCPSLSETYKFLDEYFTELAAVFPSQYFHVGCDESWDIGCCKLCRQRLNAGETQSDIFAAHMIASHEIISGKLGKRMLMWDDMFEQYPEALDILPRDIVMCNWNYSIAPDLPVGHFNNGRRLDPFKLYNSKGFDYIFSTGSSLPNIELFTRYAQGYKPLGGLVTIWELKTAFIYRRLPAIAFAGQLWTTGINDFAAVTEKIFSIKDNLFVNAIEMVASDLGMSVKKNITDYRLEYSESDEETCSRGAVSLIYNILLPYIDKVEPKLGKTLLEDICTTLEQIILQKEIEDVIKNTELAVADDKSLDDKLKPYLERLVLQESKRVEQWNRWRKDIEPCNIKDHYICIRNKVDEICCNNIADGLLHIYFFLPDQYGAPFCSIAVKYQGEDDFEPIASGSYKDVGEKSTFYSKTFRIAEDKIPKSIKLEVWGYGGQGFSYMVAENRTGHYVPHTVLGTGNVLCADNILDYDRKWCYLGVQDINKAVIDHDIALQRHNIIVELAAKSMDNRVNFKS